MLSLSASLNVRPQQQVTTSQPLSQLGCWVRETFERDTDPNNPEVFHDLKSFESSLGDQPIFTRALIEQAAQRVEHTRSLQPTLNLIGVVLQLLARLLGLGPDILWHGTFSLAKSQCSPYSIYWSYGQLTAMETLNPDEPDHPLRQRVARMPDPPELKEIHAFEAQFVAHPFWKAVQKKLDNLNVEVKNIVCVALGSLIERYDPQERGKLSRRTCMQHLLACAISKHLSQRYHEALASPSPPPAPIPIVAFDPVYDLKALHILSRLSPPITVVSDPYQYLSITPNTLVIDIGLMVIVPIYEIAADLCFPSGPAALLTCEFVEHPWHAEGKAYQIDRWTPRVGRMVDLYDPSWIGKVVAEGPEKSKRHHIEWAQKMMLYARKE